MKRRTLFQICGALLVAVMLSGCVYRGGGWGRGHGGYGRSGGGHHDGGGRHGGGGGDRR